MKISDVLYLWVAGAAARDFRTTLYSSAYNSMLSHSLQEMRWEPATYRRNLGVVTLLYIPPLQGLSPHNPPAVRLPRYPLGESHQPLGLHPTTTGEAAAAHYWDAGSSTNAY